MSFKHLLKGIVRTGFAAAELGVKAAKTAKSAVETAIAEAKAEEERKKAAEAEAARKRAEEEKAAWIRWRAAREAAQEEAERRLAIIEAASEASRSFKPDPAVANEILGQMVPIPGRNWRMGKYPVTQKQWEAVMGFNPSENRNLDDAPVEMITYEEILRFVEHLNGLPAVKRAGVAFRLPDSDEWDWVFRECEREFIDRNVVRFDQVELHRIPLVGETYKSKIAFVMSGRCQSHSEAILNRSACWIGNSLGQTNPVGEKKPNFLGLFDLLGNVFERTATEGDEGRVCRGGSFRSGVLGDGFEKWEGFEERKEVGDESRDPEVGFRLCADGYDFEPLPDPVPKEEPELNCDGEEPPPED